MNSSDKEVAFEARISEKLNFKFSSTFSFLFASSLLK